MGARRRARVAPVLILVGGLSLAVALAASAGNSAERQIEPIPAFGAQQLNATPATDWISHHGNLFNQQYSTLTQVNKTTVKGLKIAWHSHVALPTVKRKSYDKFSAEGEPVVYNGTMYIPDAKGNIFAIDAQTGERLWFYKPKWPKGFSPGLPVNRGVAIGDGKVYMGQNDGTMVGLDAATGRIAWKTKAGDWKNGFFYTSAPTYVNGLVLSGISGGDFGARATIEAFDAKTGKIRWTFDVIPTGKQYGAHTWPKKRAWVGGGAVWSTPVVDPKLGLAYFGVGNPVPYNGNVRGKGQEWFTNSIVALRMKSGKYAWHYQVIHHDIWDQDTTRTPLLAFDMPIKGRLRHVIASTNTNGWVYMLDRRTGKPILPIVEKPFPQNPLQNTWPTQPIPAAPQQPFAAQCPSKQEKALWLKWKTPDGNPLTFGCNYQPYDEDNYTMFGPFPATEWGPSSFSQRTGYSYICANEQFTAWKALPAEEAGQLKPLGNFFQIEGLFATPGRPKGIGKVVAMNMRSNRIAWDNTWSRGDSCLSGMLSTRGGLVFVGRHQGYLEAYDDLTGKRVWRSPKLLSSVAAPAITYSVDGKQYVAVYAGGNSIIGAGGSVKQRYGSDLYAFALPS